MQSQTRQSLDALLQTLDASIERQCQRITATVTTGDKVAEARARGIMLQADVARDILATILSTDEELEKERK